MQAGDCGCVLPPDYHEFKYVNFEVGNYFGLIDILGSCKAMDGDEMNHWLDNWHKHKTDITRQFSVGSQSLVEMLTLTVANI